MTGVEIAAAVEGGLQLAVKIIELAQAASKGDVTAAEILKRITESTARNDKSTDELHNYLDEKFRQVTPQEIAALRPEQFFDRRAFAAQVHHGYATRARLLDHVTGVCLHQGAGDYGEHVERYDTGGAHVFVTRMGKWIWLHDWDRLVVAANGWNNGTISIEVSGRYCGVENKLATLWDNPETPSREMPQVVTPESLATLKQGIRWINADLFARGGRLKVIVAHRQAAASRQSDPGEEIWKGAALPMIAELGLTDVKHVTLGDGLPIPHEWDPASTERY